LEKEIIMKLIKPWKALLPGDRYETDLPIGYDLPKELHDSAVKAGVAEAKNPKKSGKK